jgi:D-alanyl-D-alanine dipeptidase/carboxypeptidase
MLTLSKQYIYTGNLILVNSQLPLNHSIEKDLVPVAVNTPAILMERSAATMLSHIFLDMNSVNEIIPVSGYRSENEQKQIYNGSLRDNGKAFTEKYVAFPNHSEHQTGLAIDLALKKENIDFIRPDFPYYGICDSFRRAAPEYGFVERYQKGKEQITGIAHEPWHFRYVGYPHSEIMSESMLSLEEYIEDIKRYPFEGEHLKLSRKGQHIEIFYVSLISTKELEISVPEQAVYQISGNNKDGVIITLWRNHNERE